MNISPPDHDRPTRPRYQLLSPLPIVALIFRDEFYLWQNRDNWLDFKAERKSDFWKVAA